MSFVHLVPDHHGDGLLGTMLLDYKSVKLYRKILLTTESIFEQILDWGLNSGRMWNIFDKKCQTRLGYFNVTTIWFCWI